MEIVRLATVLGLFLVKALSILAILYIPMIIGAKWLPKIDNKGLFLQPAAWMLPLLAGVLAGLSLINYNLDPDYFTVNNLFRTDGPWALSWTAFITDRVNPFNYSFDPVFAHLSGQGEGADLTFVLAVAALSLVLMVVKAWLSWRSAGALRGILFGLALAIWACYLTIFAVCLTAWLLNQLNFWTLAVVTIMVHLHRSHTLPIHVSTLMAPVAMAVGGHGHGHGHGHGGHGHGHGGHNGHGHNGHGHGGHGHGGHGHHVPDEDREVDLPDGLTHSLT